jgi:hypothetical protein
MFTGIQSGTISGGSLGVGNFTRTISNTGNVESIATQIAYAGGKDVSRDATVTRNLDGSITKDVSITLANGNTIQRDTTLGRKQDGTRTITGSIVSSTNQVLDTISGTQVNNGSGTVSVGLTLTNTAGKNATLNDLIVTTNGTYSTSSLTGTNFSGDLLSPQTIETLIASQTASS